MAGWVGAWLSHGSSADSTQPFAMWIPGISLYFLSCLCICSFWLTPHPITYCAPRLLLTIGPKPSFWEGRTFPDLHLNGLGAAGQVGMVGMASPPPSH